MKPSLTAISILVGTLAFLHDAALACSCMPKAPTEVALTQSAIVVQGEIVGVDTVLRSNSFTISNKGVRFGRDKLIADTQLYVRIKFFVETRFKSTANLPDTIFVLTKDYRGDDCGAYFRPYYPNGTFSEVLSNNYIIYAESWYDKNILNIKKKGKRYFGEVVSVLSTDTFFTSRCMRTQPTTGEELSRLEKIAK